MPGPTAGSRRVSGGPASVRIGLGGTGFYDVAAVVPRGAEL
ncbi:MAG: hypothetical protein R2734_20350 [Nocardioides sp.]